MDNCAFIKIINVLQLLLVVILLFMISVKEVVKIKILNAHGEMKNVKKNHVI